MNRQNQYKLDAEIISASIERDKKFTELDSNHYKNDLEGYEVVKPNYKRF